MPTVCFRNLNATQFLGALNDNIFKLVIIYLLIDVQGQEYASHIAAIAGVVFVVPFLLFITPAGVLADRYSKSSLTVITKIWEVLVMALGIIAFYMQSPLFCYSLLFLMAMQSAVFGPSKYGLIPEIVPENKVFKANGLITSFTYLAIILGTTLASVIPDLTNQSYVSVAIICLIFSFIGLYTSLQIAKTPGSGLRPKIRPIFVIDIFYNLREMKHIPLLLTAVFTSAYFLLAGAYIQLNIIPYALDVLGLHKTAGGYLFLTCAVGIGIGSYCVTALFKGSDKLYLVAYGGVVLTVGFFLLSFIASIYAVATLLVIMGIAAGFFIVPLEAYIQLASPPTVRGRNVATSSFLGFIGVLIASGLIIFFNDVLELRPNQSFALIGAMTGVVTYFFYKVVNHSKHARLYPDEA